MGAISTLKKTVQGLLGVDSTVTQASVEAMFNVKSHVSVAAAAGTAVIAETIFDCIHTGYKVKSAYFSTGTTVVAGTTQYVTITLYRRYASTQTAVATLTSVTAITANTPKAFTIVDTAAVCSGTTAEMLTYQVTKTGDAGATTAVGIVSVLLERMDP